MLTVECSVDGRLWGVQEATGGPFGPLLGQVNKRGLVQVLSGARLMAPMSSPS
jgi:hypothetical protein